ncbi:hypothetical protein HUE56_06275 (plasmid) [Azospirillum oryzae]|uniref:Restriction endonuclease n=1 Tax=Azospirillum oryzae TaxID=286727 RepID=A0A6N1AEG2_9PROT|nr:hypothetical protein [Azospirillum oryzae]KAA0588773.1 hypothetical protein FZ938_13005 [Azospirillum oryzae]QKS50121.1 hypothetical protein HUE56_06275 [Azospirillum oryzae]GLR81389.1 hypothetical protein GCM10007856_40740 [Azospirillum oryzae]
MPIETIRRGLDYAAKDYGLIALLDHKDVKPKEDQIKCALYRALSEDGYSVRVESSTSRGGCRSDLLAVRGDDSIGIEIKTAWAGSGGWNNKFSEQSNSWTADIGRLKDLCQGQAMSAGYFVLGFAHERGSRAEANLRRYIAVMEGDAVVEPVPMDLPNWNGLDSMEFHVMRVFRRT